MISKKCNIYKIVVSITFVICNMVALTTVPGFALNNMNPTLYETVEVLQHEENSKLIAPRYLAITSLKTELDIDSSGRASCIGEANASIGYTCSVTLELQQKNGSNWNTIKEWISTGRYNSFEKSWYVKKGFDYQLKISTVVFDSSDKVVETPESYSLIVSY